MEKGRGFPKIREASTLMNTASIPNNVTEMSFTALTSKVEGPAGRQENWAELQHADDNAITAYISSTHQSKEKPSGYRSRSRLKNDPKERCLNTSRGQDFPLTGLQIVRHRAITCQSDPIFAVNS
ncbi:hypothetical protein Mapa_001409 [Marchantia paleacea]|nr:hypothetical protein Mapa_001409 [Marchantia paleacea]